MLENILDVLMVESKKLLKKMLDLNQLIKFYLHAIK